jgi:predicted nucleic acid-binding protein
MAVGTSLVTLVEARAALARRRHAGDLTPADHRDTLAALTGDWERLVRIALTEPLAERAARLAEAHRLRAYDAIQLASALLFAEHLGEETVFGSWDDTLDAAAAREGLRLLRVRRR